MMQATESLLSPSESNALHRFFSQLEDNLSPEWSMYVGGTPRIPPETESQLTRATKSLIALDSQRQSSSTMGHSHLQSFIAYPAPVAAHPLEISGWHSNARPSDQGMAAFIGGSTAGVADARAQPHQGLAGPSRSSLNLSFPNSSSSSTPRAIAPSPITLLSHSSSSAPPINNKRRAPQLHIATDGFTTTPDHPATSIPNVKRPRIAPQTVGMSNSAPPDPNMHFPFSAASNHAAQLASGSSLSSAYSQTIAPSDSSLHDTAYVAPDALSKSQRQQRSRPSRTKSSPTPTSNRQRSPSAPSSSHTETGNNSNNTTSKSTLLTASQKKANHIQSEQKRRANIRKGYEELCEVVPALRDAIRVEDAQCASTGKKRGRGRLLGEDGEKMDGRAGPRSESVVLQKTIEHMMELLGQREELMQRLQNAESALGPGHPAIQPSPYTSHQNPNQQPTSSSTHARHSSHSTSAPPQARQTTATQSSMPGLRAWERIWDGGIGLPLNGDGDEQDDEDDGSDDEMQSAAGN